MATRDERVLAIIATSGSPICELCLVEAGGFKRQQDVNPITRAHGDAGRIGRGRATCSRCGKLKKVVWADPNLDVAVPSGPVGRQPWHWEGHVVASVVSWLVAQRCTVLSIADTASKQRGPDILVQLPSGEELRVEAKGHPAPARNATQMARHCFSDLLTEAVILRGSDRSLRLALALPRLGPYTARVAQVAWLREHMELVVFWVADGGDVELELPHSGEGWWSELG